MTAAPGHSGVSDADPWVARFRHLAPRGRSVLDVACGTGRNGRVFLKDGYAVVFADRNTDGVADLTGNPAADVITCDLETGGTVFDAPGALSGREFGCIVVVNYLHRPLFDALIGALASDGVLLYATFMVGNEAFGKPSNPDFLLKPNELLERVGMGVTVMGFEQGEVVRPDGGQAVRQSIAVRKRIG